MSFNVKRVAMVLTVCGCVVVVMYYVLNTPSLLFFTDGLDPPFTTVETTLADVPKSEVVRARDCFGDDFDVQPDWDYALGERNSQSFTVQVERGGFTLPIGVPTEGITAFLEIYVMKKQDDQRPCDNLHIRFTANDRTHLQYIMPGAEGRRYLNVSSVISGIDKRVEMYGEGINWRTGSASLVVFQNPTITSLTRTLVVAPHPDDAEIGAFGIYATTNSDVVTVVAGDGGDRIYDFLFKDDGEHYRVKGWLRTLDSITVPFIGGVPFGRARNLGYFDSTLHELYSRQPNVVPPRWAVLDTSGYFRSLNIDSALANRPFESSWSGLVSDFVWEINRVKPSIIITTNPLLDSHEDHQYATIALIEALERIDWDGKLFLYTIHTQHAKYFPHGSIAAVESLPPFPGGNLPFGSVLSYPVSEEIRKLNILALEAMRDLRPFAYPSIDADCCNRYGVSFTEKVKMNELYLVLNREQALRLKGVFLNSGRDTARIKWSE